MIIKNFKVKRVLSFTIVEFLKKGIVLLLTLLLCFSSAAAVVSDNDGAAFITKAEFDSLKNSFQSQIDQYNTSIYAKIDGAIASYLAGINIAKKTDVPQLSNYSDIRWMHGPYMYFTNRKFTALATSGNNYTDTTRWQILKPENRRNIQGDAYLWFHDNIDVGFEMINITARLFPYGHWEKKLGFNYGDNMNGAGDIIYIQGTKTDDGWLLNPDKPFTVERGFAQNIYSNPHGVIMTNRWGLYTGADYTNYQLTNKYVGPSDTDYPSFRNATEAGDIFGYTIANIPVALSTYRGDITSHLKMIHQPNYPNTQARTGDCMWFTADENGYRVLLRTNCGYTGYGMNNEYRIDDGLIEDNKWNTKKQCLGDRNNFRYAMYGSDEDGETNIGPLPKTSSRNDYIDLSESGNSTYYQAYARDLNITTNMPMNQATSLKYLSINREYKEANELLTMTIPLWYRVKWGDVLSPDFKTSKGNYLKKNAGYPILEDAEKAAQLKITIKYEEKTDHDSTLVPLAPDNKIKTYFKNKKFDDSSGTFYKGYTNLDGTGSEVTLNGTEWTNGKITVLMTVSKGDSVWMRIDPITQDGVYCKMTEMSVVLESE